MTKDNNHQQQKPQPQAAVAPPRSVAPPQTPQTTSGQSKQTLEQRRALYALKAFKKLQSDSSKDHLEQACREAKKLPIRARASGLGHAICFLEAKKDKKPGLKGLLEALRSWLMDERKVLKASSGATDDATALTEAICKGTSDDLRRATDETIAWLQWFNRYAEANGVGQDNDDE